MKKIIFVSILALHVGSGAIYNINSTMYYQMPPVFYFDNYDMCLSDPKGIYCTAKITLITGSSKELLHMIQDYSEHRVKHYNHSQLSYGICVSQSCNEHYKEKNKDIKKVLEECLNNTVLNKYKLKARIIDPLVCNTANDKFELIHMDYVVAAVCFFLLMMNIIGTVYHIFYAKRKEIKGNQFLMMFSIKQNWQKLVSPVDETNTRLECLRGFNGVRSINTALVIIAHSFLPFINNSSNTRAIESIYDNILYHTSINGTPVIQCFFILSGFLLVYNTLLTAEKWKMSWYMIPIGICRRWLRLTPAYALVLAVTSTWVRFAGSGPLWHEAVVSEVEDCQRDWWQNLLYINNYYDNTHCMTQTWYLAADMQLYCFGLLLCVLLKTNTARKIVFSLLFAIGVIIPGVITYMMDLDGVVIVSPEISRNYFVSDATFNNIYKRGHTNIPSYVIGLSMGFFTYHLLEMKFDVQKYKKYLWTYQLLVPVGLMITWMGSVFYRDAPRASIYTRAIYAALVKPIFAMVLALYMMGLVLKSDEINRQVLEWRGWTTPARLSYCAYILHIMVIRIYMGTKDTLMTVHFLHMIHNSVATTVITFLLATPFWLLVEAPMNELLKMLIPTSPAAEKTKKIDSEMTGKTAASCL